MQRPLRRFALLLALLCLATPGFAEDWPVWRGPAGDGTSRETGLPTRWSATENIAWKAAIPGAGHSSPIIHGDHIFVATCLESEKRRVLVALDRRTGKILWERDVVTAALEKKHVLNSFASSTPATDGKRVYVTFLEADPMGQSDVSPGNMVVAAYDFGGKLLWTVRPGRFSSRHGYCSSPILYEDKLIVNGDHDGDSYLVAISREDGQTLWKTPRENKTRSYCTPIIREFGGRTQMILTGDKCVASYDPANGKRHWVIRGPTEQFVASVVDNGELLFLTAGFPEYHMLAVRPDGSGDVTDTHIVWRTTEGCSYVPSPIACGKFFLVTSDAGIASCFDATTGKRHWKERLGKHFSSSPVTAEGRVYFTADEGVTTVVTPGEKYSLVAKNTLDERVYASPAISKGQLFLRGEKSLFCIGAAGR